MSSIDYWDVSNLKPRDDLNTEIWRDSPLVQASIQPPSEVDQPGSVGAQQAMLDGDATGQVLPWVPDLVGKNVGEDPSVLVIGPHYSGFIRNYSRRRETLTLSEYSGSTSAESFLKLFVERVVRFDEVYYRGIEQLLHGLVDPRDVGVLDLCRASFVRRGKGVACRRDEASEEVVRTGWHVYTRYVESERPRAWTLRRIYESNTRVIVVIGSIAEHGLLRLIEGQGAIVTDSYSGRRLLLPHTGLNWTAKPADSRRRMHYWLRRRAWWQTHLGGRSLFVLPVTQPFRTQKEDPFYEKSRAVFSDLLSAAYGRHYVSGTELHLERYRPLQAKHDDSGQFFAEDLLTGRTVLLKTRDLREDRAPRVVEREVQMLSLLNRPEFLLCTDYGRDGKREIAAYEYNQEARLLSDVLRKPLDREQALVGPAANFDDQRHFLRGLAEAVNAMHSQGIVHGAINENAVWVWPVGGTWLSKLANLHVAAAMAVSPEPSSATISGDVRDLIRIIRVLLDKTDRGRRGPHWHHLDSVLRDVEHGDFLDAGSVLDAISRPDVGFEDRLRAFEAQIQASTSVEATGNEASELVRAALSAGRVSELPYEALSYVANSSPELLAEVVQRLIGEPGTDRRLGLIKEVVNVLSTSGDIDSVHQRTCVLLLGWRPPRIESDLIYAIHDFGALFFVAHPADEIGTSLAHFCRWGFSKANSPDLKRWWIDRLRSLDGAAADELESKYKQDLEPCRTPLTRKRQPDLRRTVPETGHHLDRTKLTDWARRVYGRFDYVWRVHTVRNTSARPCVGRPTLGEPSAPPSISVILGEEYTENRACVEVVVTFAPGTSKEQLRLVRELFLKHKDLFPSA